MATKKEVSAVERFNLLYKDSFEKVCRFAGFYVRNRQVAEDITMDAFLKLFEVMKQEVVENGQALLVTMVKHRALDYLRSQMRREDLEGDWMEWKQRELEIRVANLEGCDPSQLFSEEIRKMVADTLRLLPEQTRRVFVMSRMEHKSGPEIAQALGLSLKGVEYHMSKALKELRVALKDYLPLLAWLGWLEEL